ncbi:hypothetical protein SAMN05444285_12230 [Draconibacterium orientale]|uniref:Uncharacterized protein n=1 Tax=Draconibacterium orientale TaxID=1168034 RepID=A0A1I0GWI8_9BACT|nr:hypothetical protein SAMN05444285_12230 [Draconibacterium orientale]
MNMHRFLFERQTTNYLFNFVLSFSINPFKSFQVYKVVLIYAYTTLLFRNKAGLTKINNKSHLVRQL